MHSWLTHYPCPATIKKRGRDEPKRRMGKWGQRYIKAVWAKIVRKFGSLLAVFDVCVKRIIII